MIGLAGGVCCKRRDPKAKAQEQFQLFPYVTGTSGGSGVMSKIKNWMRSVVRRARSGGADSGMTTSEYAVGTIAACAFAAVLYKVVTSAAVMSQLQSLLKGALDAKF